MRSVFEQVLNNVKSSHTNSYTVEVLVPESGLLPLYAGSHPVFPTFHDISKHTAKRMTEVEPGLSGPRADQYIYDVWEALYTVSRPSGLSLLYK
jgi:hypothetical protein